MPILQPSMPQVAMSHGSIRLTPPANAKTTFPLVQTVELLEGEAVIASATWFTTGTDGHVQLLDIRVDDARRRRGVGSRCFRVAMKEAAMCFRTRGSKLRRITCHAEQKSHIVARAFLTHLGFHHVQTIGNTLRDQDVLVYLLSAD